jgi:glucose/arabinose dehydrogenase
MDRTRLAYLFASVGVLLTTCLAHTSEIVHERIGSEYQTIRIVRIVGGLEHPWSMAFLPDGGILVTERPGRLNLIRDNDRTRLSGVPQVAATGQGGLLDVAVHPNYEENGWVYLTYSKGDRTATATTLVRARLQEDRLSDVEEIFTQDRRSSPGRHYGSRLAFTPDDKLLMTIGDRGAEPDRAQDLMDHAGSLLRLNDDGSVPQDNPFVDRQDAHPEIFAYGLRNIQALTVHPETGEVWASDHGPRGGDKLIVIEAGENHGWPLVSRGLDYGTQEQWGQGRSQPGMVEPIYEFLPTLAPSGLTFVTGDRYPRWKGDLLIGGLRAEQVRRVVLQNRTVVHAEELIRGRLGRIRDVQMGPDDYIYVINDEPDGGLYRIEPR